jgi:hypothetical protein
MKCEPTKNEIKHDKENLSEKISVKKITFFHFFQQKF